MTADNRHIAIYVRVSSRNQDHRSQIPDLEQWGRAFAEGLPIKWYRDKQSGKTMDRPGWTRLEADLHGGKIRKLVVWRIDRLGRTAAGLTQLFENLQRLGVGFESVRDHVDLSTPAGRLMAHVVASVGAYENEVRGERIRAGQAAAKAEGKRWGGSKPGQRKKVSDDHQRAIQQLKANGLSVARIAQALGLSRPTIYSVLAELALTD